MRNYDLEKALMHAGEAKDISSLKALARQESDRADRVQALLAAVLRTVGPVRISGEPSDVDNIVYTMEMPQDGGIVLSAPNAELRGAEPAGGASLSNAVFGVED